MNLILDTWNNDTYNSFINLLNDNSDMKYQIFHKNLLNSDINLIGVRTPVLKDIAKQISKGNYLEYITLNKHQTYEEILIHGLIIGYIKEDINRIIDMLNEFIPYINNWAVNDIVAANIKIFKKEQTIGFLTIKKYIASNNNWEVRFGLVLLLAHYINNDYIDHILKISSSINTDDYYVKMANAWLISVCYIKYPDKTIKLFKMANLDHWTNNKAIQKIKESYRVNKENKAKLDVYKKQ